MKFEVQEVPTHKEVIERVQTRTTDDLVTTVERAFLKPVKPGFYGHEDVKEGDVIEISDKRLIAKARKNELLKEIRDKDLEARQPNTMRSHLDVERYSPEWLAQRQQFRRR